MTQEQAAYDEAKEVAKVLCWLGHAIEGSEFMPDEMLLDLLPFFAEVFERAALWMREQHDRDAGRL